MRRLGLFLLLFATHFAFAAPPTMTIPTEIKPENGYVIFTPAGDAKTVSYIAQSGAYPLPSFLLADKRTFVLPVANLKDGVYKFTAVGSLNDEHVVKSFEVPIGKSTDPIVDPVIPITKSNYFIVVYRPPLTPTFNNQMSMKGWDTLIAKGYTVKPKTDAEAKAMGLVIPNTLPAVIGLYNDATTKKAKFIASYPFPTTEDGILQLEGK